MASRRDRARERARLDLVEIAHMAPFPSAELSRILGTSARHAERRLAAARREAKALGIRVERVRRDEEDHFSSYEIRVIGKLPAEPLVKPRSTQIVQALRAAGLCVRCKTPSASRLCAECAKEPAARRRRLRRRGKRCSACLSPRRDRKPVRGRICEACRLVQRERSKDRYQKLRDHGRGCGRCGKPSDAPTCDACRDQARENRRKRKAKAIAKGLCVECAKNPPAEGKKRCQGCLEISRRACVAYRNKQRKRGEQAA